MLSVVTHLSFDQTLYFWFLLIMETPRQKDRHRNIRREDSAAPLQAHANSTRVCCGKSCRQSLAAT